MRRKSSNRSTRLTSDRARRRVVLCAEPLETRQLLSVAALPQAMAPVASVPVAVGPAVSGASQSAAGAVASVPIVIEWNAAFSASSGFQGFTETIFIVEEPGLVPVDSNPSPAPVSTGIGSTEPISTAGDSAASALASTPAITPLTATILAPASAANHAPVIAIVPTATTVTFFGPSSIPVTTQAILATAALEEQPIQPPVLGQGFESGQTQGLGPDRLESLLPKTTRVPFDPQLPPVDFIEPFQPAPVEVPRPVEPAPVQVPALDPLPMLDIAPDAPSSADRAGSPELSIPASRVGDRVDAETPSFSMAAMVGVAAIAGGSYRLVLGRSRRFNQRWLPDRGRRHEDN